MQSPMSPRRRFFGMTCAQVILLSILGFATLGVVGFGSIYILRDTGFLDNLTRSATAPTPTSETGPIAPSPTISPTTASGEAGGISLPATWTPIASPTQEEATPTPAWTPTSESEVDTSKWVLTLEDLPEGFESALPEELGLSGTVILFGDDPDIESSFAFSLVPDERVRIFGFTTLLPTTLDQERFDEELRQRDQLMETFIGELNAEEILDQQPLSGLGSIGHPSTGFSVQAKIEGDIWLIDVIVFRRDIAGATVINMYLEGDTPARSVVELAITLDDRISDTLSSVE